MKIIAINGSARKDGNTAILLRKALGIFEQQGMETELVQLAGQRIRGCTACFKCAEKKNRRCVIEDDIVNACIEKMDEADGILLGSPTYFANVSAEMKALLDRSGVVGRNNDYMFRRKVGAAVVAVRRGGAVPAFDAINHMFMINQMIVASSIYWNFGIGKAIGEVDSDAEGMATIESLADNMAWLLEKIGQA